MFSANTNISVLSGLYHLGQFQQEVDTSMERLATGKKINRASDDPAGSMAADSLTSEITTVKKQMENDVFEEKHVGAVEGAQSVVEDLIQELVSLVPSSANRAGLSPGELQANQDQVDSILQTLDHLAGSTRFDGDLTIRGMTAKGLGLADLGTGGKFNLIDGDLEKAQQAVSDAVDGLSSSRAGAGMRQKQLQTEMDALEAKYENLTAARSQIVDTDYASETAQYVRASMLRDASAFVTKLAMQQNTDVITTLLAPLKRAA